MTFSGAGATAPGFSARSALSPEPPAPGRFVLLGGVPGSGKSTVLREVAQARPGVRSVDSEHWEGRLRKIVPDGTPYRLYRPAVHALTALETLVMLTLGPTAVGAALVVHDPATRSGRRATTVRLARLRGWVPVLVMLDVDRDVALAGQLSRGRVVPPASFEGHWRRWSVERERWRSQDHGVGQGGWHEVVVTDRASAAEVLGRALDGVSKATTG